MGRKRSWPRQHILLFHSACLILLGVIAGCRLAIDASTHPDRQLDRLESYSLDQAESYLQKGDYAKARKYVDRAISCCANKYPDRAAHVLGSLIKASDGSIGGQSPAIRCVKQLEASTLATANCPDARCWAIALNELLTTQDQLRSQEIQIRELQKQITQLKAVDLETQKP